MTSIPLSILELAVVPEGGDFQTAINNTIKIAQHAEKLGYKRIWMAEHHNMPHVASSATAILIGHIAGQTSHIRVGSGGIMLPNHSPLIVAEQFGTLESIYPGRIDLGLGRAPGSDQETAYAIRRNNMDAAQNFPKEVRQLQQYFSEDNIDARVRAFPGEGLSIPFYILGSSTESAYLAAELGLPYAFAAHFAPAQLRNAIKIYKSQFKASSAWKEPYMMACVNVIAADTDAEAQLLFSSLIHLILGILTNKRKPMQPPGSLPTILQNPEVKAAVDQMLACTSVGSMSTIRTDLSDFIEETGINELLVASHIYDLDAKLKSYGILKEALSLTENASSSIEEKVLV